MRASWLRQFYSQVIIGIVAGAALGFLWPGFAVTLQPLADGFIKLIKMLLAPVIFATVVLGIAKMGDIKEVGRIGVRASSTSRSRPPWRCSSGWWSSMWSSPASA